MKLYSPVEMGMLLFWEAIAAMAEDMADEMRAKGFPEREISLAVSRLVDDAEIAAKQAQKIKTERT